MHHGTGTQSGVSERTEQCRTLCSINVTAKSDEWPEAERYWPTCNACGLAWREEEQILLWPRDGRLPATRAGDLTEARELFAAVVHWCPMDAETRNALALANYQLDEHETARTHWQAVLDRSPGDRFTTEGLARLVRPSSGKGPAQISRSASSKRTSIFAHCLAAA